MRNIPDFTKAYRIEVQYVTAFGTCSASTHEIFWAKDATEAMQKAKRRCTRAGKGRRITGARVIAFPAARKEDTSV